MTDGIEEIDLNNIEHLQRAAHDTAVRHGWWENPPSFPEVVALIHSEASEALEAYRDGLGPREIHFGEDGKPEGIAIELADIVIRVADYCEHAGISLAGAISIKHFYNEKRPYRHGGKVI